MTTAYTSLLGLALPVTGELSGTWGSVVNDSITSLVDTSVAGTTNISTDANVTLTTTTGASNQARQAILLFSGARTAVRTVTAPAQSKIYTVINATTGGFAVTLVGAGPTTGLTIPNGASATVAWNGSDFIEIGTASIGNLTVNGNLTVTGSGTLKNLLLTGGTLPGASNPSIALRSSDNIIYHQAGSANNITFLDSAQNTMQSISATANIFNISNAEAMRLTSTGLGIGTSSPANPLHIVSNTVSQLNIAASSGNTNAQINLEPTGTGIALIGPANNVAFAFRTNATERLRISADGNLGLGVTPSAWGNDFSALQIRGLYGSSLSTSGAGNTATTLAHGAYNNNTNWIYGATGFGVGRYEIQGPSGGGTHQWFTAASGTAGNAITFTQAMTLDASGNLLVGLTSSSSRLHVDGGDASISRTSGNSRLLVTATGVANTVLGFNNSGSTATGMPNNVGYVNVLQAYPLVFGTDSTERARIDSSGNLLVGTTSTDPIGNGSNGVALLGSSGLIDINRSAAPALLVGRYTSTGQLVNFYYANSSKGSISTDGTNVAYNTSSDYRLKENIVDLPNALATVIQLKPRQFDWKETNITTTGFIAHELAKVVPQCVTGEKDAVDEDGKPVYQGIDTSFLVATLTAAIQEQQAIIESLKARLDAANL